MGFRQNVKAGLFGAAVMAGLFAYAGQRHVARPGSNAIIPPALATDVSSMQQFLLSATGAANDGKTELCQIDMAQFDWAAKKAQTDAPNTQTLVVALVAGNVVLDPKVC